MESNNIDALIKKLERKGLQDPYNPHGTVSARLCNEVAEMLGGSPVAKDLRYPGQFVEAANLFVSVMYHNLLLIRQVRTLEGKVDELLQKTR